MEIKHFSHEHVLSLSEKKRGDLVLCRGCCERCVGPTYSCRERKCRFNLHESCAKLPLELHNPLHPHPLALLPKSRIEFFLCNACHNIFQGFIFRCDKCDINLDLKCAFIRLAAAIEEREEAVGTQLHFSHHEHPLLLFENITADCHINCRLCGKYCSDPTTYGCFPCSYFLHRSCFERNLPRQIQHFFHPCPSPLNLYTTPSFNQIYYCRACSGDLPRGTFFYGCSRCQLVMDVDCTLLPTTTQSKSHEEQILHFLHGHPLSLISNIKAGDEIDCYVCEKRCTDPTYTCFYPPCANVHIYSSKKKVYFHKSCLDQLPQQIICHPFHPFHPLTLKPVQYGGRCNSCGKEMGSNAIAYDCESKNCRFDLHIECGRVIMPAITYQGHDHLLQFTDNMGDKRQRTDKCSACNIESTRESYGFSCLYCEYFSLHHTCGPLPSTIKHKSHIHPLILTTSPLEDEEDCEPDEFYCDACEEQRVDPFLPIYYCKDCHFVADVKCVISEVVSSLNGEYGEVELRNPLGQFGKVITKDAAKEMIQKKDQKQLEPTLTWGNYLSTLSEDEIKEKNLLTDRIKKTITAEKIEAYDHEEIIMFSDKAYTQFMKFLNHSGFSNDKFRYPWDLSDHENKEAVVNVGDYYDYMTTRKLAPILNHLLSNHGDIGAKSTLSTPKFKSLYVCMLCKCIDHMRHTMVVDITHDILLDWWTCLKILQLEGFQIDFAFDRLKRVTHAYFGRYVEKEVDDVLDQLEKLTRKVKRIKSAKSSLIEECLREASVLKKDKAATSRLL